jgi:hypothetical protein
MILGGSLSVFFRFTHLLKQVISDKTFISACVVPFSRASGETTHVFFVIGKSSVAGESPVEAAVFEEPKEGPKLYYVFNNSGNVCTTTSSCMIMTVADDWMNESPGLHHYLWMDNLQTHCDPSTLLYAYDRGLVVLFLPKCTTHLFQPLDQYPFALLKRFIKTERRLCHSRICSTVAR